MKHELLYAKRNLTKSKGQTISIFILVVLASLMMSIWLILSLDYKKNFDKKAESLNSEECALIFNDDSEELVTSLDNYMKTNDKVIEYTLDNVLSFNSTIKYGDGEMMTYYIGLEYEEAFSRELGKFEMVEETNRQGSDNVYLPYLMKTGGAYKLNDNFHINIGSHSFDFVVAGFYESTLAGSFNSGIFSMVFEREMYDAVAPHTDEGLYLAFNGDKDLNYTSFIYDLIDDLGIYNVSITIARLSEAAQSRTLSANICQSVISVIAIIITVIVLIVILFSLSNQIDEDMKDLGTLKAMGYKNHDITVSLLMQYLLNAFLACVIGIALSYAILPLLASVLEAQTGIIWNYSFSIVSCLITLVLILLAVFLVVFSVSRKLKRLPPIVALREGIKTHSFKKNVIPLESTKLKLNLALSIKNTFNNIKQNIVMLLVTIALTLLLVTTTILIKNFVQNPSNFVNMVAGEVCDGLVTVDTDDATEIKTALANDSEIEKVYQYDTDLIRFKDDYISAYVTEECSNLNNQKACFKGRFPLIDTEVALGAKLAKDNNIKIGDTVTLKKATTEASFVVCGFIQITNFFGMDCQLTADGFKRLGEIPSITYYFDVNEGVDVDTLIDKIVTTYQDKILNTTNVASVIDGSLGSYLTIINMVIVVIVILSILIILFVLYLMVKLLLHRRQTEFGVLKALGYKSSNLIFQTAFSFMPAVIIGVILGSIITPLVFNPLFNVFLSGIGIVECAFDASALLIILFDIGTILISFGICVLLASKIKKISPTALLSKE